VTTVALVGSTGSIGTQTLDVIRAADGRWTVEALAAARSVDILAAQAVEFRPRVVAIADAAAAPELAARVPKGTEVLAGPGALGDVAAVGDVCVNAVVGFAGLPVTLAALGAGRRLALANKESLIAGGPVVQAARRQGGGELIPIDSEHCAVHQCLRAGAGPHEVAHIVLTASGGPFRGRAAPDLEAVTVADALAHPTWSMGAKITVDSSTLMNKGLEVIEAHELFGVDFDRIDVVVHPQSVVHSMVEFVDGATVAQLSQPDMRLCIGYALGYPERLGASFGAIDWSSLRRLDFEAPDRAVFRCLDLAYEAGRAGGTAPAWLSAANEEAVAAFLAGALRWVEIASVIDEVLQEWDGTPATTADVVLEEDAHARDRARRALRRRAERAHTPA
jgi:1-deoxy-D-xylulose-5-phosphate reductoisomerase